VKRAWAGRWRAAGHHISLLAGVAPMPQLIRSVVGQAMGID